MIQNLFLNSNPLARTVAYQRFGGEQVAPFQSDETTNRLPSLSLNIA